MVFIYRLAFKEHVTVAAVCSSACALLWEAMPKPAPAWGLSSAIGGKLPNVVSSNLINIQLFCLHSQSTEKSQQINVQWFKIRTGPKSLKIDSVEMYVYVYENSAF